MHAPVSRRALVRNQRGLLGSVSSVETKKAMPPLVPSLSSECMISDVANLNSFSFGKQAALELHRETPCGMCTIKLSSSTSLSLSDILADRSPFSWNAFKKRYEARYLGAFDSDFIRFLVIRAPHAVARLVCSMAASNPRHVAKILEVFGEIDFPIHIYSLRSERKSVAAMLTHPSLGPYGSAWLFNEIQRQLADWVCCVCSSTNASTSLHCKKCSSNVSLWVCHECGLHNKGSQSACAGCGSSMTASKLTLFRWRCEACSFINPMGRLDCQRCSHPVPLPLSRGGCEECGAALSSSHPWCTVCGLLNRNSSRTVPPVRIWACLWCGADNHSMTQTCVGCGEERVGSVHRDWYQWSCSFCDTSNPFWKNFCRKCHSLRLEDSSPLVSDATPLCSGCGKPSVSSHEKDKSPSFCAVCSRANTSKWVCITDACAAVNDDVDRACRKCGIVPLLKLNDDALAWSAEGSIPPCSAICVPSDAIAACRVCKKRSSPMNLVCSECSVTRSPLSRAEAWVVLKSLHDHCQSPLLDASGLASIESAAASLCSCDVNLLPWRGVDIETGRACEAPTSPVTLDGNRHFGIRTLRDILLSIVSLGRVHTLYRRPLIKCALSLVELSNATTDFDEIGFDCLKLLCSLIRPQESQHIENATRIHYLVQMKLTREAIVNNACCLSCFCAHDECSCFEKENEMAR